MDTKIANVLLKKILKWVSKTDYSGFNVPNIEKGLKLSSYQQAEEIFGFLKQEGYIQHVGGNSPLYRKTSKVISELNTLKSWHEKPLGIIIIIIISGVILALLLHQIGLDGN